MSLNLHFLHPKCVYACRQDSNMEAPPAPTTPGVAYYKLNPRVAPPASPCLMDTEQKEAPQEVSSCLSKN